MTEDKMDIAKKPQWGLPAQANVVLGGLGVPQTLISDSPIYPAMCHLYVDVNQFVAGDTVEIYILVFIDGLNARKIGRINIVNGFITEVYGTPFYQDPAAVLAAAVCDGFYFQFYMDPGLGGMQLMANQTVGNLRIISWNYNKIMPPKWP